MLKQPDNPAKTNLERYILSFFNHGQAVAGVIFGRRGTGKTDNALFIAEALFKYGLIRNFASNIKIYKTPPGLQIDYIYDLQTLDRWASISSGRKLYILDEAGKAFRRRSPMAKLNIELLDKLQTLRKYKLSLIMVTPAQKYVDGASLGSDVIDFVVVKPEFQNPKVGDYYDTMRGTSEGFHNIPGTSIKFDSEDIAPFTLKPGKEINTFPSKAVEFAYKNAKLGMSSEALGIDHKQMNRYYKQAIIYYVEKEVTGDILSVRAEALEKS